MGAHFMSTHYVTLEWSLIRYKGMTSQEKFIYAEIAQLNNLEYGCIAENSHFSELLGVEIASISRSINNLKRKGYINVNIKNGSRNMSRKITLNKMLTPPYQNVNTPLTKCLETKGNNRINNRNKEIKLTFPENLNKKAWNLWLDYRKEIKKPLKEISQKQAIKKLIEITKENQLNCILNSIENGYQGFFIDKYKNKSNNNSNVDEVIDEITSQLSQPALQRNWKSQIAYTIYRQKDSSNWGMMSTKDIEFKVRSLFKSIDSKSLLKIPEVTL
jgi:hypothetical protein